MDAEVDFQKLDHGSADVVLAIDHNLYGNKMAVACGDHMLRVWDKKGSEWSLSDTWRGHDSEILDVKWNGPYTGALFASIGTDGFCKLWLESPTAPPRSGKRYRLIQRIITKSSLPWQSLSFKNVNLETYLALTTFDGNLCIFEPRDHANLTGEWSDWFSSSDFHVLDRKPPRSDETSFKVTWAPEKTPCYKAVEAGLDKKSMGLSIAAMENVKIFRTDKERKLYLAAELVGAKDLIRDVAWSRGAMRGWDVIATASKDSVVRVYELYTPASQPNALQLNGHDRSNSQQMARTGRSGIGAGLAELSRTGHSGDSADYMHEPSRVKQEARLVAELRGHVGAVWTVTFSFAGDLLMSTGDDGSVRTWKRTIDGKWDEYAEINADSFEHESQGEETEEDDEDDDDDL